MSVLGMPPRWNPYAHGPPFIIPMHREYELTVRQEPKQARMCGVGGKADRRPIDPPPIVQLRVIDPAQRNRNIVANPNRDERVGSPDRGSATPTPGASGRPNSPSTSTGHTGDSAAQESPGSSSDAVTNYADSYLQNPYYFMFASLAKPDDDAELHWLKDGRTRCTTGSVVSSLYHLKDPQNQNEDAGFFVFPDLSVRTEGSYRLKLSLFEVVDNSVRHCKSIFSAPFYVYTAKKFPGMEESTPLSCSLADQGIKIRIRKDIRVRKRPMQGLEHPLGPASGPLSFGAGGGTGPIQPLGPVSGTNESTPYAPAGMGGIPPPASIPPPPGATMTIPPPPGATMVIASSEHSVQLPIPQPNPHGGLSLPGVDRKSLPMPSAPGIGKGVVIEEDEEGPPIEYTRRRNNPARRTSNADDMDDDDDYDDQMEEDDDDDDEYREDGRGQLALGRRNPSTRRRKTTPKRKESESKTRTKISAEDEDELMDDDQESSFGRRGASSSGSGKKAGKKASKGREAKRQKRSDDDHTTADAASEAAPEEMPAQTQPVAHPVRQHSYHPPHVQWGHAPPAADPALQPPASAPPQSGTPLNTEATNGNGMMYDARYQYYDASQSQSQQQPAQPYQAPPVPPPSAGQYMTPGYPPPGQYGYSMAPPGQYAHQQYYQPGVQAWGPPMNYPPLPVYGPPTDPYANFHHPPQQQPQQQYQPRYDYAPHHHPHSMYAPPPVQHYPGYYEQPLPPAQYPTATTTSPATAAPSAPSEGTPRGEYSNGSTSTPAGQRSASPAGRYPAMPSQQPPPPHHMAPPPYYQPMPPPPPQHYPGPYNMYGMYPANGTMPASGGDPWGTPPTNWQGNGNADGYAAQQQAFSQQVVVQTRQVHQPPSQDKIQLAPLRVNGPMNASSPTTTSSTSGGISPTVSSASASHRSAGGDPFPVIRLRSGSQSTVGYNAPSSREHDERDRDMDRGRRDERGKRNPLSIGSIISDETA